jgi:hypothetical protein
MVFWTITLVGEGNRDHAIAEIIEWIFRTKSTLLESQFHVVFAEECVMSSGKNFRERVVIARQLYPANLYVIHRDVDGPPSSLDEKTTQIMDELDGVFGVDEMVLVLPVRSTEAWLTVDEMAIRIAVGNRNGNQILNLPALSEIESELNIKAVFETSLQLASGLNAERWQRKVNSFGNVGLLVAKAIVSFEKLRRFESFNQFENLILQWARRRSLT